MYFPRDRDYCFYWYHKGISARSPEMNTIHISHKQAGFFTLSHFPGGCAESEPGGISSRPHHGGNYEMKTQIKLTVSNREDEIREERDPRPKQLSIKVGHGDYQNSYFLP